LNKYRSHNCNELRKKNVISSVPKDTDVLFIPILIDTQSNEIKFFDQNYFYNKN